MGHVLDTVGKYGHYGLDAVAAATGNPELIPAIEGANSAGHNYASTHNFGSALKSGALSAGGAYLGSNIGSAIGGAANVGDALETGLGRDLGSFVGQGLGGNIMNTSLGSIAGGAVGSKIAGSYAPQGPAKNAGNYPFVASQQSAMGAPPSISGMSTLSPLQQATGLANQGTYGGGLGRDENKYFLNLENRKLVNSDRSTNPLSTLTPIENSYLSKLGLGGYGDTTSLMKAISQWSPT